MNSNGYIRIWDRVNEHINALPQTTDIILIILKGHLLIEEEMNRLIKILFKESKYILKNNFSFHEKLCILRAMIIKTGNCLGLWEIIELINNIRNEASHQLFPINLSKKLNTLFRKTEDSYSEYKSYVNQSWDEARRVRKDLGYIIAVIAGLSDSILENKFKEK